MFCFVFKMEVPLPGMQSPEFTKHFHAFTVNYTSNHSTCRIYELKYYNPEEHLPYSLCRILQSYQCHISPMINFNLLNLFCLKYCMR